jgi:hypothetical protein
VSTLTVIEPVIPSSEACFWNQRIVGSWSPTHIDGLVATPPAGMESERESVEERTLKLSLPLTILAPPDQSENEAFYEAAREELVRNSGTQFDPRVVEALLEVIRSENVVLGRTAVDVPAPAPAH